MIFELENYAKENNIPIMQKDALEFITKLITTNSMKNVLEIGSAIGYSAIYMARTNQQVNIVSIEKDKTRYLKAVNNVNAFDLENRISLIFNDALNINLNDKFDLILIDAAKSKNIEFFNHFKHLLKPNGFIIIDNINFHGYVGKSETIKSKNLKKLVLKIEKSIKFLKEQKEFAVKFIELGDGLAICKKIQ